MRQPSPLGMLAKRQRFEGRLATCTFDVAPALGIVSSGLARCTWPRKNGFSLNGLVLFQERLASIARSISTLLQEKVNVVLPA
ncbi:hypothetical protein IE4803_PB00334 (plasmid) [Rhizobium etli bv. phaseoli str. IE4803]|nr:hypothetical protein IE4803_PB00334 [Rhizobium etli bv. phaseoli str. IE4803]